MKTNKPFKSYTLSEINPVSQLVFILVGCLIAFLTVFSLGNQNEGHWMVACSGILFFAVSSPIISVFQSKWLRYFGISLLIFIFIIIVLLQLAKLFSGESLYNMRAYQMIVGASFVFYFLSMGLARLIKAIFQFTSEEL